MIAMPTADQFRAMQNGDPFTHDGRSLRLVRFRAGKATCVDEQTGERVNLFPEQSTPPAVASESAGAVAGARTEQE